MLYYSQNFQFYITGKPSLSVCSHIFGRLLSLVVLASSLGRVPCWYAVRIIKIQSTRTKIMFSLNCVFGKIVLNESMCICVYSDTMLLTRQMVNGLVLIYYILI